MIPIQRCRGFAALTLVSSALGFLPMASGTAAARPAPVGQPTPQASQAYSTRSPSSAPRAQALIAALDYDEARRELADADPGDAAAAVERARLAIYELDCDGAATILARPEVSQVADGEALADVARGCERVTAALAVDRDDVRAIEVLWQDEHDRALAPLLFETVEQARDALTRDLGVDWPKPTRIVVVRDLLSLSAMTGLPYKSAQTTGTVAVAKWGRVTLLSPRASPHGYAWRDTVAHELTHLAVTRATADRAPLWLQEGVAKREEQRWRSPGPFDGRPPPDAVARRGLDLGLGLSLDKLGPSIAMLPSAEAAMVAFAEVTSFVAYYVESAGDGALPKLLGELKDGKDPDEALRAATGRNLAAWDARWRAYLASYPRQGDAEVADLFGASKPSAPAADPAGKREGRALPDPGADAMRDLRDGTRLGELLLARGHAPEAVAELDRIELAHSPVAQALWGRAMGDPSVRWLRARALEAAGRRAEGESLVADPRDVVSSYGPWWATRGRWARLVGDEGRAAESFTEAVAADPFDPEGACQTIDLTTLPPNPADKPLCEAARAAGDPPFGGD